jgi:hypothetical protein
MPASATSGTDGAVDRHAPWLLLFALVACEPDTLSREQMPPEPPVMETPDAGMTVVMPPPPPPMDPPDAGEPVIPPAREPVYINTGDTLYSYDPETDRATVIGAFRSNQGAITGMVDIAIDLSGRMYGGTTEQEIFRIDPDTARATHLARYDDILHGLTFLSDGRLVVAGRRVTIVDPLTGRTEEELVGEGVYETSGDIIGLPDGKLYWSVRGGRGEPDLLVRIDPRTSRTEELGATGVEAIYGLGFADSVLYGFLRDGARVALDQRNGRALSEEPLEGRWYGATTNPVLW